MERGLADSGEREEEFNLRLSGRSYLMRKESKGKGEWIQVKGCIPTLLGGHIALGGNRKKKGGGGISRVQEGGHNSGRGGCRGRKGALSFPGGDKNPLWGEEFFLRAESRRWGNQTEYVKKSGKNEYRRRGTLTGGMAYV